VGLASAVACGTAAATPSDATGYCAVANTLYQTDPAAAKAALVQAALIDPAAPCIKRVQAELAPPSSDVMKDIEDWIAHWTKLLGALAVAGLAGVLVIGSAFGLATRLLVVRRAVRRVPLVGRLLQPRVSLGTFADGGGGADPLPAGVQALVDNALQRLTSADRSVRLGRSSGTDSASDTIGRLGDLAPQFKALAAIVGFVARISALPVYTVNGTLQGDAGAGLGLTLTLDRGRHAADAARLVRKKKREKVEATYQVLALVAAGWIDYAIRKDARLDFDFVASPRSIGYFRAGVVLQSLGREDDAMRAYDEALRIDGTNVGALVNLARLYEGDPARRAQAPAMLQAALEEIPAPGLFDEAHVQLNPVWYQAMYSLAAHHANEALRTGSAAAAGDARRCAFELADAAAQALLELGYRRGRRLEWLPRALTLRRHRVLADLLHRTVEPGAIMILANFAPEGDGYTPRMEQLMDNGRRTSLRALLELAAGSDVAAGAAARALVRGYVVARKGLSPRARFNVVCYYATPRRPDLQNFGCALQQLRRALADAPVEPPQDERRMLARATWQDESLVELRAVCSRELEQLTAPYRTPPPVAARFRPER
jgi:tetratricopeptide (TPR) repeat protein